MKQGHFEKGAWIEHNPSEYCDICGFKYSDHPSNLQQIIDERMETLIWSDILSNNSGGGVMQVPDGMYTMDFATAQPSTKYPIEETYDDLSTILLGLTIGTIIILAIIYILFW